MISDEERDEELISLVEADQQMQLEDIMHQVYSNGLAPCICRMCEFVELGEPDAVERVCTNCGIPAQVSVARLGRFL